MRILVAPVVIGDRICRIVSPVASLLEVEEWAGEWWEPSSVTITTASQAPAATERLLRERGVPLEDCISPGPRAEDLEIQMLMRACDPEPRGDPLASETRTLPHARTRERQFTGNRRFRRHDP